MRLNPNDPQRSSTYCALAFAHFIADRYGEALKFAERAWREQPEIAFPRCIAAASAALAGQMETAQKAMVVLRQLDPNLRLSNLRNLQSFHRAEAHAKWEKGMRLAGLPE
jgi:adenylate cyclase